MIDQQARRGTTVKNFSILFFATAISFVVNAFVQAQQGKDEGDKPQVITAEFLPHEPGSVHLFDVLLTKPDNPLTTYIGQRSRAIYKSGGVVESKIIKQGVIKLVQTPPADDLWLNVADVPQLPSFHRENAGFLEVGNTVVGQKEIQWEPVLKLGAKNGETWKWKDRAYTLTFTIHNGLPAAKVEVLASKPDGSKATATIHFVRELGQIQRDASAFDKEGKLVTSGTAKRVMDSDFVLRAIRKGYLGLVITENQRARLVSELRHGLPYTLTDADAPALIKAIESSKTVLLQSFAIAALGNIGADVPAAMPLLQKKLDNKETASSAKDSIARISEIIEYRKHVAGKNGQSDPIVRVLLKDTSKHYMDFGFKKYTFGMSIQEVNDLTAIGIPGKLPWSASMICNRYRNERKGWLGNDLSGEAFFFIDGKLAGFTKKYRNDVQGLRLTVKDQFGTATPENRLDYTVHDRFSPTFKAKVSDEYYLYPKTVVGITFLSASRGKEPGTKGPEADDFLEMSVVDRQWCEYAFDQYLKTTRKNLAWLKDLTGQLDKIRGQSERDWPKSAGGRVVLVEKRGEPARPKGTVVVQCSHGRTNGLPEHFDSLVLRGIALLADEYFPSDSGKMVTILSRTQGYNNPTTPENMYVHKWQTKEGWEVGVTRSEVYVTIKPKRQLD